MSEILYRLRVQEFARRQIEAEALRLAERLGDEGARDWLDMLQGAIATLSIMPQRCPIAPEASRFDGVWRGVRHLIVRRRPGAAAWRVLFLIEESDPEAPTVRLLTVLPRCAPSTHPPGGAAIPDGIVTARRLRAC